MRNYHLSAAERAEEAPVILQAVLRSRGVTLSQEEIFSHSPSVRSLDISALGSFFKKYGFGVDFRNPFTDFALKDGLDIFLQRTESDVIAAYSEPIPCAGHSPLRLGIFTDYSLPQNLVGLVGTCGKTQIAINDFCNAMSQEIHQRKNLGLYIVDKK